MTRPLTLPAKLTAAVLKPVVVAPVPKLLARNLDAQRTGSSSFTADGSRPALTGNRFATSLVGPNPPEGAGTPAEQAFQLVLTANLAALSVLEAMPFVDVPAPRAEKLLKPLEPSRLIAGSPVTKATYTSHIPGASPDDVFGFFKNNLSELFGAGGLQLHPAPGSVTSGDRFFVEDRWSAPWMPIEAQVDAEERTVRFDTLDGHPFRGFNAFTLQSDGEGGTRVVQSSEFQASSEAAEKGYALQRAHARQVGSWRALHEALFEAFA